MSKAEKVKECHHLDQEIRFYIIPPGIVRREEVAVAALVGSVKKTGEKINGMGLKQVIFLNAFNMIGPGIHHLCHLTIVDPNPSIKNSCQNLQQKKDHQLWPGK